MTKLIKNDKNLEKNYNTNCKKVINNITKSLSSNLDKRMHLTLNTEKNRNLIMYTQIQTNNKKLNKNEFKKQKRSG